MASENGGKCVRGRKESSPPLPNLNSDSRPRPHHVIPHPQVQTELPEGTEIISLKNL